ncbi:phage gpG-like protein [Methanococcus voltae]|uniref:Phage gpG-like protein n=1 Tax=Methanococcus voltae TaxID=2188 RepID=A0A8J7S5Z1_METVO|nr:HK97 gp10 family phage protein [Methanococcus voltae]MBP2202140.1 phage gpG-like protein [Methanococcus voltae]
MFKINISKMPNFDKINKNIEKEINQAIVESGTEVENGINENIRNYYEKKNLKGHKKISEKYYKRLYKLGKVPHRGLVSSNENKTKLQDSIHASYDNMICEITCSAEYAKYLEFGRTTKSGKIEQPFFYPAVKEKEDKIKKRFSKIIENSI